MCDDIILLKTLLKYFRGQLLKRAGHPVAQAQTASSKIEMVNAPLNDAWKHYVFC
jgi:hypothetical protein